MSSMAMGAQESARTYPWIERGFFHLTPMGWLRWDTPPFPADRVETWAYEMECPADDAKERVCLTRTWACPAISEQGRAAFRALYGQPVQPQQNRNVTLECEI